MSIIGNPITLGSKIEIDSVPTSGSSNAVSSGGVKSYVDGSYTIAGQKSGTTLGTKATAEGENVTASGIVSHAEGGGTTASRPYAHAEGASTTASGSYAHAEGSYTMASGQGSHAEGASTTASGANAHAEGNGTVAQRKSQHVFGEYNTSDTTGSATVRGQYVEIVGNGTSVSARSNARTLDWSGNEKLTGKLTLGAAPTADMDAATKKYVDNSVQNIDASNVVVTEEFVNPLNMDQLTLGQTSVYFTAYPSITWQVQHLDGDYAYLALYPMTETSAFGSSSTYSGSTIAAKCTTFLNNTIPNVADYLEEVTVNGVAAKVFIPSFAQMTSEWDWPKANASNRICQYNGSDYHYWLSTANDSSSVRRVDSHGNFTYTDPSWTFGFRPAVKVRYKGTTKDLNTALDDIGTEINTLKTSVSEGKAAIASAITDKGVSTASDASFSTMATNIESINMRTDGTLDGNDKLLSGYTAYGSGGTKYTGSIITYAGEVEDIGFDWGDETATADADWFKTLKTFLRTRAGREDWVGKTKSVTLTSEVLGTTTHLIRCIGVNQDADNTVTFQTANCLDTLVNFSSLIYNSSNNVNGSNYYDSSNLIYDGNASSACKLYYDAFPGKASIKQLNKGTCVSWVSGKNGTATYKNQYVWIPSEGEIGQNAESSLIYSNWTTTNGECTYGKKFQYSYYTDNNKRIKIQNGSAVYWWRRNHSYYSIERVDTTSPEGSSYGHYYGSDREPWGVAPAFCIGN